ncbi:MAG: response regulator [Bacteroidota bacterium]|nr:response regulator [Bacteroidota bacterium]
MKSPVPIRVKTVFLIDDDADDRNIFQIGLTLFDKTIELVTASGGVQAIEKMNSDELFLPDYIFLDLNMPYMSGKECLIHLREIKRLDDVPVILYSTISYFEELKNLGATSFATKPNSIDEIVQTLAKFIK